jgi:hypothetical protein
MKGKTVRINFEFPSEEYPFLKMMCAEQRMTIRDFGTDLFRKAIEEYEDRSLGRKARSRLKAMDQSENISFKEATESAGWDE